MRSSRYRIGRAFLCRAEHHSELVQSILDFVREKKIKMAVFSVIGAVDDAVLAYYDHEKQKYKKIILKRPLEIANSFGNISSKDGQPFAHLHAVLSDAKGRTYAGHLISATVFAAEIHFLELLGEKLEREPDQTTGLALWRLK
ncbi:MAG: DNA-binding protein [Hadesarchaea archaeon]|nr:DNA-binding protein [Hadesarchaea archaeon]